MERVMTRKRSTGKSREPLQSKAPAIPHIAQESPRYSPCAEGARNRAVQSVEVNPGVGGLDKIYQSFTTALRMPPDAHARPLLELLRRTSELGDVLGTDAVEQFA
jgi:hypothetical protein